MEKRLIDANALKEELGIAEDCDDCERLGAHGCVNSTWAIICDRIESAPTIYADPVVRCKHCRFSEVFQNDSSGVMARYCNAFRLVRMVADDDYCSYGERKDDELL